MRHSGRNGHKFFDNVIVIHSTKELPAKKFYTTAVPVFTNRSHAKKPKKKGNHLLR
jgi:hypothetical protein